MKMRILCPECATWTVTEEVDAASWRCARCDFLIPAVHVESPSSSVDTCRACGNSELYVQKDFPHWLGMGILVTACVASVFTYAMHWLTATWAILIGSALIDGALFLMMGNVTVCYRCGTHFRGFPQTDRNGPFNLAVGERYRQEKIRRSELGRGRPGSR